MFILTRVGALRAVRPISALSRRQVLAAVVGAGALGAAGYAFIQDDRPPIGTDHVATDWPTFNHDSANTGAISTAGATRTESPSVTWRTRVKTVSTRSYAGYPVVADDLLVYPDGPDLRAFDVATGEPEWAITDLADASETDDEPLLSAPTVTDDLVVVGTPRSPATLRAYTTQGSRAWETRTPTGGRIGGAPAYDRRTDALYAGTTGERLLRLDPATGDIAWTRRVFGAVDVPVAVANGTVYAALRSDGAVVALDPADGRGVWRTDLNRPLMTPPTVADAVSLLDGDGTLYALELDSGAVKWTTPLPQYGWSVPVALTVGARNVYAAYGTSTAESRLYAVDARSGTRAWTASLDSAHPSTIPVVVGNWDYGGVEDRPPTVYLPTGTAVRALRTEAGLFTSRERWRWTPDDTYVRGVVPTDDRLIVPVARESNEPKEQDGGDPITELVALE